MHRCVWNFKKYSSVSSQFLFLRWEVRTTCWRCHSYDNLIQPIVDTLRYLTSLSFDVLSCNYKHPYNVFKHFSLHCRTLSRFLKREAQIGRNQCCPLATRARPVQRSALSKISCNGTQWLQRLCQATNDANQAYCSFWLDSSRKTVLFTCVFYKWFWPRWVELR